MSWNVKRNNFFFIFCAVNFFSNSVIAKKEEVKDFNAEAINAYQEEVDILKQCLEKSDKKVLLKDKLSSIATPLVAATVLFGFFKLYDYYFTQSQEKETKGIKKKEKLEEVKKKTYKEIADKKFIENAFSTVVSLLYNELFLEESAPVLNNKYLMGKYKKLNKLSDEIYKFDQVEGKLFGYAYALLAGSEKTLNSLKNVIARSKDVTVGALSLFIGFAILRYEMGDRIKKTFNDKLDSIQKLDKKPIHKELLATASLLALDYYLISPLFESLVSGVISMADEYLNKKSTKVIKNMTLGQMTRIVFSNPFTREERSTKDGSGKVHEKLKEDVKLFNDLLGIWKYSNTMYSLFKTIKKVL